MGSFDKVKVVWSSELAYAVGLITTDGCLYRDGKSVELTSKDKEQLMNFKNCLGISNKIGYKVSGQTGDRAMRIQFRDAKFYNFLIDIGLTPHKSKTLKEVRIPDKYFFDFLRGHFDGDGTFYSYWDPRWRSSFMFYTVFISASEEHARWLQKNIQRQIRITGHITKTRSRLPNRTEIFSVKYAKRESLKLLSKMYYNGRVVCLSRKLRKIQFALAVEKQNL